MASRRRRNDPIAIFEDENPDEDVNDQEADEPDEDTHDEGMFEEEEQSESSDADDEEVNESFEASETNGDGRDDSDLEDNTPWPALHDTNDPFTTSSPNNQLVAGAVMRSIEGPHASHSYDGSFSTTSGIHLDDRRDPSLNYIEPETPTPDENVPDPFSREVRGPGHNIDPRKVSESTSTLPDELEYYHSPIPGRSPLAIAPHQGLPRYYAHNAASRNMPYPPTHSRSNSAARYDARTYFRSPSSVKALQMSSPTPPPFEHSPLSGKKLMSPSRNDSGRPYHVRQSNSPFLPHSSSGTPTRRVREQSVPKSERKSKPNHEFPLVLLHCTLHIIPIPASYSPAALAACDASERVKRDTALLQQKLDSTVMERGILIQHPAEEYDVLEERILESLELKKPRLGGCGHFRRASEQSHAHGASDANNNDAEPEGVRCEDCRRPVSDELLDDETKEQHKRFEVKVYAANGLMRAGAWAAAWREMEKVDVEVGVWLGEADKEMMTKLKQWSQQREMSTEATLQKDASPDRELSPGTADIVQSLDEIIGSVKPRVTTANSPAATPTLERPSTATINKRRVHLRTTSEAAGLREVPETSPPATEFEQAPPATPVKGSTKSPTGEMPLSALLAGYIQRLVAKNQSLVIPTLIGILALYLASWSYLSRPPSSDLSPASTTPDVVALNNTPKMITSAMTTSTQTIAASTHTVTRTMVSSITTTIMLEATPEACSCSCPTTPLERQSAPGLEEAQPTSTAELGVEELESGAREGFTDSAVNSSEENVGGGEALEEDEREVADIIV